MTDQDAKRRGVPVGAPGLPPPFSCHSLFPTVKTYMQLLLASLAHAPHPLLKVRCSLHRSSYNRLEGPP